MTDLKPLIEMPSATGSHPLRASAESVRRPARDGRLTNTARTISDKTISGRALDFDGSSTARCCRRRLSGRVWFDGDE